MVLAKALVDQEREMDKTYDPEKGHILPEIPLHKAREIMTRADFIQSYDHINVFTIDSKAMVRAGAFQWTSEHIFKEQELTLYRFSSHAERIPRDLLGTRL